MVREERRQAETEVVAAVAQPSRSSFDAEFRSSVIDGDERDDSSYAKREVVVDL